MAAGRTVSTLGGGCVGNRYRLLAEGSFRTDQMKLRAGMLIMACQTGNGVLSGMNIVEISCAVTEVVFGGFFLGHECRCMALKTELFHRDTKLKLEVGGVLRMTGEAVFFHDRRVDTLLARPVIVALVTDFRAFVLGQVKSSILQMIAGVGIVTRSTLSISQTAVNKGGVHFTGMAFITWFSGYRIKSCSRDVSMVIQSTNYCQSDSNNHLFHQNHLVPVVLIREADVTNN